MKYTIATIQPFSIKLIHDTYPEIKLLVTGSSSLDLSNKITEPLTGRSIETILYPLSVEEVSANPTELAANANIIMVRGGYPGMWKLSAETAFDRLSNIATNYLYRDAFSPKVLYDQTIINNLLRLLAYQIGSEVNYSELGRKLSINNEEEGGTLRAFECKFSSKKQPKPPVDFIRSYPDTYFSVVSPNNFTESLLSRSQHKPF